MSVVDENIEESLSYRQAMKIVEVCVYQNGDCFAICPRCEKVIEIEYQAFCGCCGQRLQWRGYRYAKLRYV